MKKEAKKITKSCSDYWKAVKEVIDAAGDYAATEKLHNNYLDETTSWKVEGVIENYFDGSLTNLVDAVEHRKAIFYAKVRKLNILCKENMVSSIRKPDVLLNLLLDERRRSSYKGKMRRRLKNGTICRLQDFELGRRG